MKKRSKRRILFMVPMAIAGGMAARSLGPKLRERCMAGCERMFEQMPDDFPPKRMLRGIEESRANTARILELLEERQGAAAEPKQSELPAQP